MPSLARVPALASDSTPGTMPSLAGGSVQVQALDLMGHVLIQVPGAGNTIGVGALAELALPAQPNRGCGIDPVVLWLGPRAWVALTVDPEDAPPLAVRAAAALRDVGGDAVDLTDAHQSVRVTGRDSPALLAQGCPIDLEGPAFTAGAATRTLVGRMPAIVHRTGADAYVLHVDRSVATQLWDWLARGVDEIAGLSAHRPGPDHAPARGSPAGRERRADLVSASQRSSRY